MLCLPVTDGMKHGGGTEVFRILGSDSVSQCRFSYNTLMLSVKCGEQSVKAIPGALFHLKIPRVSAQTSGPSDRTETKDGTMREKSVKGKSGSCASSLHEGTWPLLLSSSLEPKKGSIFSSLVTVRRFFGGSI